MTEYFSDSGNEIPSYFYDYSYNVNATELVDDKLSPENELAEYFIQFRTDDLVVKDRRNSGIKDKKNIFQESSSDEG